MSDPPRARGSYKKSETSRRQVLEAAITVLAERGFSKTSVSDIARAAGLSKGAVHYHFDSKDDLIACVLEECAERSRALVRAQFDGDGPPAEKIRRSLVEMRRQRRGGMPELRVMASLTAQAVHDERLREVVRKSMREARREFAENFGPVLESLGLRSSVPLDVLPRLLFGTVDGLAAHDFFDPIEDDGALDAVLAQVGLRIFSLDE